METTLLILFRKYNAKPDTKVKKEQENMVSSCSKHEKSII